jgi:hypothetical protein
MLSSFATLDGVNVRRQGGTTSNGPFQAAPRVHRLDSAISSGSTQVTLMATGNQTLGLPAELQEGVGDEVPQTRNRLRAEGREAGLRRFVTHVLRVGGFTGDGPYDHPFRPLVGGHAQPGSR